MTPYTERISKIAPNYDPRHIEAFMRTQHSTLDRLSNASFRAEVRIACACIEDAGTDFAERIAKSFGL